MGARMERMEQDAVEMDRREWETNQVFHEMERSQRESNLAILSLSRPQRDERQARITGYESIRRD